MFLADNIGSVTSPNNIGNVLSNEGEIDREKGKNNVAGKTVDKYIGMLKSAFIFYSVSRYDIKGKQLLKTLSKNYIIDLGFRPDEKLYIQVTETMSGETTRERELRPLRLINDNYEKIVLSMDRSFIKSYEGIKAVNIIDFLLEEQK